jgi:uncharacterized protein (TIGR02598 family)
MVVLEIMKITATSAIVVCSINSWRNHVPPFPSMTTPVLRIPRSRRSGRLGAFSLIEVVLALAVFSFSMLTIVGVMATGLSSAGDSSRNVALANIQRLLRANVNAVAYANISAMGTTPAYYTSSGYPTTQSPTSAVDNPYFTVMYTTVTPKTTDSVIGTSTGKVVLATVTYPFPSNVRTNTFSLFIAQ